MAKTPAERQAAYRKRREKVGENGERRINTWVKLNTLFALGRLARHNNITRREMLERLIESADENALSKFKRGSPAWRAYSSPV